jgi:hypothetical protein
LAFFYVAALRTAHPNKEIHMSLGEKSHPALLSAAEQRRDAAKRRRSQKTHTPSERERERKHRIDLINLAQAPFTFMTEGATKVIKDEHFEWRCLW